MGKSTTVLPIASKNPIEATKPNEEKIVAEIVKPPAKIVVTEKEKPFEGVIPVKSNLQFITRKLKKRAVTNRLVLHHTATRVTDTAETIHGIHLRKEWAGAGYHYMIRQEVKRDGTRYWEMVTLRPVEYEGSHCLAMGRNRDSIGLAIAGNFENVRYTKELHDYLILCLKTINNNFGGKLLLGHHQMYGATACPGINVHRKWDLIVKDSGMKEDHDKRAGYRKERQLSIF